MSKRPIEQKQRNRVAKMLRKRPLDSKIDLVQWLIDRGHARTRAEARKIILAGRVRSESHTLGVKEVEIPVRTAVLDAAAGRKPRTEKKDVVAPLIDSRLKERLTVLPE